MLYYFEIKNHKTNENRSAIAKNMMQACKFIGWKVRDCKCIYKVREDKRWLEMVN